MSHQEKQTILMIVSCYAIVIILIREKMRKTKRMPKHFRSNMRLTKKYW